MPEHWQAVFVFCQERDGYALHGRPFIIRILVLGNGMALQNVRQVTLVLFTILRTDVHLHGSAAKVGVKKLPAI
jgi:hypothetical protein